MDGLITKRLHISGITPALSPADLSQRLSIFGTVKALDGFGLRDGVGQPRKFGYVTMETTAPRLAKCLNLLNGSTWKGAKLRIGEAKPDFAERLKRERESAVDPPRKRPKRFGGMHAKDMSLVTRENVEGRAGWKVTPLGRIMRPVRMRPDRPLVQASHLRSGNGASGNGKHNGKVGAKRKKMVKISDIRARRRTIDMTKYGSLYLKGMFLDPDVQGTARSVGDEGAAATHRTESDESEAGKENEEDDEDVAAEEDSITPPDASPHLPASTRTAPLTLPNTRPSSELSISQSLPEDNTDMNLEKTKSLHVLQSLFGDRDGGEWGDKESVSSNVDDGDGWRQWAEVKETEFDSEVDDGEHTVRQRRVDSDENGGKKRENPGEWQDVQKATPQQGQATKLKDLFAPKDEEGFSLLGHLDIDLELDDEVPFPISTQTPVTNPDTFTSTNSSATLTTPNPSRTIQSHSHSHLILDPKQPLFFPLASSFPSSGSSSTFGTKARSKDMFDVARENGWSWRDPNFGFWRKESEEEIKARWEGQKVELTRDWKRRYREAGKVKKRDAGGAEAD